MQFVTRACRSFISIVVLEAIAVVFGSVEGRVTYLMLAIVILGVGLIFAPVIGGVEIQTVEQPRVMAFAGPDLTNAIVATINGLAHAPLLIFLCALCGLALLGRRRRPTSGPDGH